MHPETDGESQSQRGLLGQVALTDLVDEVLLTNKKGEDDVKLG